MFLRVVRANVSKDEKREYVRVVEAYRDHDGKTRHRTVINLGRRDLLATHLDLNKLGRCCTGKRPTMAVSRAMMSAQSARGTGGRCWPRVRCGANSVLRRCSISLRGLIAAKRCG
jgi:hypothetical protein